MAWSIDSVINDTTFNNLRLSYTREDVAFANACFNADPSFATQRSCDVREDHPGWDGGNSTTASARVNNSVQIDDTVSWYVPDMKGDHDFRIGGNYSYRTVTSTNSGGANGDFEFPTDADFNPDIDITYPDEFNQKLFGPSGNAAAPDGFVPGVKVLGLFVQDDWQVIPNLTLNLGVRYDWESIVSDSNNLAPRLGFSWDPTGDGRTVVRGGYGRFYERFQYGFWDNFVLDGPSVSQGFFEDIPDGGTDQQFFIDYANANGIRDLNTLRDSLTALLEAQQQGAEILNTNPTVDNQFRRSAYADTFTVGAEREVIDGLSIGADLVRTQNRDQLMSADLNPRGGASLVDGSGSTRPDMSVYQGEVNSRFQSITTYLNAGVANYTALQMQLRRRFGDSPIGRFGGTVAYTYANQGGNTQPAQVSGTRFQIQTDTGYNFDQVAGSNNGIDYGTIIGEEPNLNLDNPKSTDIPASWHRDNILSASWTWEIPGTTWAGRGGIMFSGIYQYMSGQHDELAADIGVTDTPFLDNSNRDLAPPGVYDCNITSDICQGPTTYNGRENGYTTDGITRIDLSFRYIIPVERFNITVLGDIFNATNAVSFGNSFGSDRPSSGSFLIPNSALQAREFQIGARVDF